MYFSNYSRRRMCNPPAEARAPLPELIPMAYDNPKGPECHGCSNRIDFINRMRLVWLQHVYWTRLLIVSIAGRLMDKDETAARLLENPADLAKVFADFYPKEITNQIQKLITEHLQIGGDLITATRDGDTLKAEDLNRKWYKNADEIADFFASINPHYDREEVRRMFYMHLDLTKQEVAMRIAANYPADIAAFNAAEQEMLAMAEMFIKGILEQFPERFNCR